MGKVTLVGFKQIHKKLVCGFCVNLELVTIEPEKNICRKKSRAFVSIYKWVVVDK